MTNQYYRAYEKRYQTVQNAGIEYWGHTPDDTELTDTLTQWVDQHNLKGKRIIEFFCGEGAAGVILSKLGCIYHGVDISPAALQTAGRSLVNYPNATVAELDVVSGNLPSGHYDAALDVMGIHMLVADPDRVAYLKNAHSCLKVGAPMLFFRELSAGDAIDKHIDTFDEWLTESNADYTTLRKMSVKKTGGGEVEVEIPYVPGRSKTKEGYRKEISDAGFAINDVIDMPPSNKCPDSVSIYVKKM